MSWSNALPSDRISVRNAGSLRLQGWLSSRRQRLARQRKHRPWLGRKPKVNPPGVA